MRPSRASRSAFLAAAARPFSRRMAVALSRSPSASVRARLQSMKPAPVRSRNSLTSPAEMSAMLVRTPVSRRAPRPAGVGLSFLWATGHDDPPPSSAGLGWGRGLLFVLFGRLAGKLGGDLLWRGLGRRLGDGSLRSSDAVAREQVVVLV